MSAVKASPFSFIGQELMPMSMLGFSVTFNTLQPQVPLSMGLSRQEYWSGLPFPPPGDIPKPGIEPSSLHWQVDSLQLSHLGSPTRTDTVNFNLCSESPKLLSENSLFTTCPGGQCATRTGILNGPLGPVAS